VYVYVCGVCVCVFVCVCVCVCFFLYVRVLHVQSACSCAHGFDLVAGLCILTFRYHHSVPQSVSHLPCFPELLSVPYLSLAPFVFVIVSMCVRSRLDVYFIL